MKKDSIFEYVWKNNVNRIPSPPNIIAHRASFFQDITIVAIIINAGKLCKIIGIRFLILNHHFTWNVRKPSNIAYIVSIILGNQ